MGCIVLLRSHRMPCENMIALWCFLLSCSNLLFYELCNGVSNFQTQLVRDTPDCPRPPRRSEIPQTVRDYPDSLRSPRLSETTRQSEIPQTNPRLPRQSETPQTVQDYPNCPRPQTVRDYPDSQQCHHQGALVMTLLGPSLEAPGKYPRQIRDYPDSVRYPRLSEITQTV